MKAYVRRWHVLFMCDPPPCLAPHLFGLRLFPGFPQIDLADLRRSGGGGVASMEVEDEHGTPESFQCYVCLDLIYKPVVLECGHISCFWCVHKAMSDFHESNCAVCRQPYTHFPAICQLLHYLLLKIEPVAYKIREEEVLEEEKRKDNFSPQFIEYIDSEASGANASGSCGSNLAEQKETASSANSEVVIGKAVSVADVQCSGCKGLLFRPSVLNCGHVYCDSCMAGLAGERIICQTCQSRHPGALPKICLELDRFLQKQFPTEYEQQREAFEHKQIQLKKETSLSCASSTNTPSKKEIHLKQLTDGSIWIDENISKAHVGVGCDTCGMYPIIGKRYKCMDCKESIGFDLCEACYDTSSKRPGRFNQQHTPDHKFVLDDTRLLANILREQCWLQDDQQLTEDSMEGDSFC